MDLILHINGNDPGRVAAMRTRALGRNFKVAGEVTANAIEGTPVPLWLDASPPPPNSLGWLRNSRSGTFWQELQIARAQRQQHGLRFVMVNYVGIHSRLAPQHFLVDAERRIVTFANEADADSYVLEHLEEWGL